MIHMNPAQSWSTILVLVLLVIAAMWLMQELGKRADEKAQTSEHAALATVTERRPSMSPRHLAIVEVDHGARKPARTPALYDWQAQGL